MSASVDVDQVDLARLQLKSVSGNVVAAGRAREAQLETVSGALRSTVASARLSLGTVSGQIDAPAGASGVVSVESVSGQIRVGAGQVSQLRAESVSGATALTVAGLAPGGSIAAESVSGTISLGVPRNVSAALQVEVFSGDIRSVAGQVERPEYGPGKSLRTRLGPVMATSSSNRIPVRCVSITATERLRHLWPETNVPPCGGTSVQRFGLRVTLRRSCRHRYAQAEVGGEHFDPAAGLAERGDVGSDTLTTERLRLAFAASDAGLGFLLGRGTCHVASCSGEVR